MKGKKMILVILIIMLTVVVMAAGVGMKESDESKNIADTEVTGKEFFLSDNYQKPFADAGSVTVEKVERTTVEDMQGNSKTTYQNYAVSDVDLKAQKDDTEDYVKALASDEMDDSLVRKISFEEAFGFSYDSLNGSEILQRLMERNGFDGSLYKVDFDKQTYDMTKQNLYVLKDECGVIKKMLKGVSYDELFESTVSYQTVKTEDGVVIPDCITATVKYRAGDKTYTKNVFLQVSINNWEETEGLDDV